LIIGPVSFYFATAEGISRTIQRSWKILLCASTYFAPLRITALVVLSKGLSAILQEMKRKDSAKYFRFSGLNGLEVMSAQWVEHSFAPHMHDFYAINLNYEGRGAFECRHEVHDATPGTCNLIAPGELHTGRATCGDGWIYRNLYVETHLMTTLLRSIDWRGPVDVRFKLPLARDLVLASRLACAFASLAESKSLLQNESLLLSVVARLAIDHLAPGHSLREAGRERAAVRRVKEWLDAHPEQNTSVHSLAELAGLSPYHLVRVFHNRWERLLTNIRRSCACFVLESYWHLVQPLRKWRTPQVFAIRVI
jgi:AraC-like ligand binding domain